MSDYDPLNWFWIIAGDASKAWSSAAGAYVPKWPSDRITRIASEDELTDVLARYGIRGPVIKAEQVNAERDRRIFGGFTFNGVRFQSRLEDQKRIAGAGTLAVVAIVGGAQAGDYLWHGGAEPFAWIAEDNTLVPMDAQTVIAFGQAAAAHESANVFAARAIKDMDPIPSDFAADSYWP